MNAPFKIGPSFDCVPRDLKAIPRWIGWRFNRRDDGTMTKVPQGTSGNANAHDPKNWMTFEAAEAFMRQRLASGAWPLGGGVGFVFTDDDDIGGIDLDGCRDPETGEIAPWAKRVLGVFDGAYVEYSPSGTGFHIIARGAPTTLAKTERAVDVPDGDLVIPGRAAHLEAYVSRRFFTVTGDHATGRLELSNHSAAWEQVAAYLRGDQPREDREAAARAAGQDFQPLGDDDLEAVRSALAVLSTDELGRNLWIAFGMVLKKEFGEDGRPVWLEWMARSPNDDAAASEAIWDGLPEPDMMGVGTIFWHAQQRGWKRPHKNRSEGGDILARIIGGVDLWHDQRGHAYATITITKPGAESHRENLAVDSSAFSNWLTREYYGASGATPKRDKLREAISLAAARATFDGPQHTTWIRTATGENGALYVDMGDDDWTAIEIDTKGWRIVADPPVRFRRTGGGQALPVPRRGNAADAIAGLADLIRPKDPSHMKLLLGFMVACLRPGYPIPALVYDCEAGSAKTSALRMTRSYVDPHVLASPGLPGGEKDLIVAAHGQWLPSFDNISDLSQDMSDALCRLITGGGAGGRKLYSDEEAHSISVMRPVILTMLESSTMQADLIDRSVIIPLAAIEAGGYLPESVLEERRAALRPLLMGVLLDGASAALRRLPEVTARHIGQLPRMADFALFAEAAGEAFGWEDGEFIEAYRAMLAERLEDNAASDPLCTLIREWLFRMPEGVIEDYAGKLLEPLAHFADMEAGARRYRWLPDTARGLQAALKKKRKMLEAAGVTYTTRTPAHTDAKGQVHRLELNARGRRLRAKVAGVGPVGQNAIRETREGDGA